MANLISVILLAKSCDDILDTKGKYLNLFFKKHQENSDILEV